MLVKLATGWRTFSVTLSSIWSSTRRTLTTGSSSCTTKAAPSSSSSAPWSASSVSISENPSGLNFNFKNRFNDNFHKKLEQGFWTFFCSQFQLQKPFLWILFQNVRSGVLLLFSSQFQFQEPFLWQLFQKARPRVLNLFCSQFQIQEPLIFMTIVSRTWASGSQNLLRVTIFQNMVVKLG